MNNIGRFTLSLPVNLGIEILKHKIDPTCSLSSQNIRVCLNIEAHLLSPIHERRYIESRKIEITSIALTLSEFEQVEPSEFNQSIICISNEGPQQELKHNNLFQFSIFICASRDSNTIDVYLSQQPLQFKLRNVNKVKFVKNERLEKIIKHNKEEWGLLSMDSSARVLLEGKRTTYPIIGIWEKKQEQIYHISTFYKMVEYLRKQYPNKCKFMHQDCKYFYYVRLDRESVIPELFIVQWNQKEIKEERFRYDFNLIKGDIFRFDNQSKNEKEQLEFTLRSDQKKIPNHTIDFSSCSPIKFIDNEEIEKILEKNSEQYSPKFQEQNRMEQLQNQNFSLREKVRIQQIQIQLLKSELARVNNELQFASKSKFSIDDLNSSQKNSAFGSSAKLCKKKLTRSDLDVNSAEIKSPDGTETSLNGDSIENFRKTRDMIMKSKIESVSEEDEPWERLSIVQP